MRATAFAVIVLVVASLRAGEEYKLGPDSEEQAGVPKGSVTEHKFTESKIYPGTVRSYWIYLPPDFNADTAYPLMVFFDGGGAVNATAKGQFRVPVVFDNLIHKKEMPALVGLFINPGDVPPVAQNAKGRSTRSYEYDTPDEVCARFLLEEMIPLVEKHAKVSAKPEDRALWGISSGGIAAFNAAWQRPDQFRKVISFIGSFTNIRGGYWFPSAIRKTERKPIRVFLQEGSNDLDNVHGNWPLGAQEMAHALKFAGYDHKFVMGDGGHSGKQGAAILPDALRWLWRPAEPLPAPTPEVPNDMALSGILIPGEDWQLVRDEKSQVGAVCSDADGNLYFSDSNNGILKLSVNDATAPFLPMEKDVTGMQFGPDGRLFACRHKPPQFVAIDTTGKEEELKGDVAAQELVMTHSGWVYFIDVEKDRIMLWRRPDGVSAVADLFNANGLALSPNQETLAVNCNAATWALRIEHDGSLGAKMPIMPSLNFGRAAISNGGKMVCDTRSRFYCSTSFGIDVYDPNGRPIGMILSPNEGTVPHIVLAGPGHSFLFAVTGGKIFKRKVNAKGFVTYLPPILGDEKKK